MILRNAAVRHGRRTMATPIARSLLRQLSTDSATPTTTAQGPAWPTHQPSSESPKSAPSSRKKQRDANQLTVSLASDSSVEHHGQSWAQGHKIGDSGNELSPATQFYEFRRIQNKTKSLGSHVERRYNPTELVSDPPRPEDVTLELLMASQTHMGHNTSVWNPANSKYIYGVRQGIHIISLETTAAHLRRAARVVEEVSYQGGLVLFVGNRKGQMDIVTKAADMAGACHLFTKWIPGSITNRDVILKRQSAKVVDHLDQEIEGFQSYTEKMRPLVPDLVVCLNPLENFTLLYECGLQNIPTIGVIDTNADPSWVSYTIPANDDSLRSVGVIGGVLGRAGQKGQQRRLEAASKGNVTWQTSPTIAKHMQKEVSAAMVKRKEVMGRMQENVQGFTDEEMKILQDQYKSAEEISEDDMVKLMGEAVEKKEASEMKPGSEEKEASETKPASE